MARRWVGLVGVTPLLLGMMVSVPQMVMVPLVLAQSRQSSQPTEAQRLYNEGERLRQRGTRESLQQALTKFQQALPLFRANGDRNGEADNLDSMGRVYFNLGQPQQALEYLQQALLIWRAAGSRPGEAITLDGIAGVYRATQQPQQALNYYQQALVIVRELGNSTAEARILANIRALSGNSGQPQRTGTPENTTQSNQNSQQTEAQRLYNEGERLRGQGTRESLQQALAKFQQALPLFRATGDRTEEANTLNLIGLVYRNIGQSQQALNYFQQALPIRREVGDRNGEAATLFSIGSVYGNIGQPQQALNFYQQALPILRETGDRTGEAATLYSIGLMYSYTRPQQALNFYQQALPILRELGNRKSEADTLSNIGDMHNIIEQFQQALNFYQQALPIHREVRDRYGEAKTLNSLASVYLLIGQPMQALNFFQQNLTIIRELGGSPEERLSQRSSEASTLNNIGIAYSQIGQPQLALNFYQQALPIFRAIGKRIEEATTLSNIGSAYDKIGQPQIALNYFQQSLAIYREENSRRGEASTLNYIGSLYRNIGQSQQALNYFQQALSIRREENSRRGEAITLSNLASLQRTLNDRPAALQNIQAAISIVEDIRGQLIDPDSRTSYFATVQDYYKLQIDLLMELHQKNPDQGYAAQAFNVTERSKARTFLELLTESKADIRTGVDPQLLQQEKDIQTQLNALDKRQVELINQKQPLVNAIALTNRPSPELVASLSNIETQLTALQTQRQTLQTQYQELQTKIRQTSPKYAALKYPQPLTLEQIQQQILDDNTLIASYSLGKDKSYLWLISKTEMTSYELPNQKIIENLITGSNKLRSQLTNARTSRETFLTETSELANILLKPIQEKIGNKRLAIIGDGALQYVPFGALPDPRAAANQYQPLLVNNEIVYLPSASTLQTIRSETQNRTPAPKTLAIIADPVFTANDPRVGSASRSASNPNDPRVGSASRSASTPAELSLGAQNLENAARSARGSSWDRLPGTLQEAKTILNLVPENSRLAYFDFDANRANARSDQLSQYRIIHWATHGFANPQKAELSGIVMSLVNESGQQKDGYLLLGDIFNLSFNADLVVLSACETGRGEITQGEGLIGLTRGLMYAGTSRVVTSLWAVPDAETAVLMGKFYEKMLQQNLKPAEALRAAQLEMFRSKSWVQPYFWAAFTLQGEWR